MNVLVEALELGLGKPDPVRTSIHQLHAGLYIDGCPLPGGHGLTFFQQGSNIVHPCPVFFHLMYCIQNRTKVLLRHGQHEHVRRVGRVTFGMGIIAVFIVIIARCGARG